MKMLVYHNGAVLGGAEQTTGGLLEAFGPHVDVTLVGAHRDWWRRCHRRPGIRYALAPPIRHKLDVRRMLVFARWSSPRHGPTCPDQLHDAVDVQARDADRRARPGVRTVLVEHLPVATGEG